MECGMERRFHRGFTAAEKTELWDRWKRGESLKAIGRAFGKESSSIYFLVAPHGGIRPAERRRSRLALTLAEREVISRGVTGHQSARSIARLLGRSPSTVSREMSRNGGCDRYRMICPSCQYVAIGIVDLAPKSKPKWALSRPDQWGVSRSSRTLERDAVDAGGASDEGTFSGRRSRMVLTPRRWRQVCGFKIRKRR